MYDIVGDKNMYLLHLINIFSIPVAQKTRRKKKNFSREFARMVSAKLSYVGEIFQNMNHSKNESLTISEHLLWARTIRRTLATLFNDIEENIEFDDLHVLVTTYRFQKKASLYLSFWENSKMQWSLYNAATVYDILLIPLGLNNFYQTCFI
ncbi:hypothetical protein BDA99DRAFT_536491 [Phascolomyces articulosus]|uniref:Uncharacterized protein n=1 Tax=Phascolomyces articulosus TaxID=60185 RepID=A0AAD5PEJ6_9FUNG|nr:hypothetical protein BDA99DRAFT_536491 [Phascolomyces articulosus]